MALQIAERNTDAATIILAGIEPKGTVMSHKLVQLLKELFAGEIKEISIKLDKKHPREILLDPIVDINDSVLVIVDDVANSGKTLTYALKPFLDSFPKEIQTLVLVDRQHKEFPIQPDYIGFSLATSLQEYIDVDIKDNEITGAWIK